jgi:nitrate reductase NapD
MDIASAVVHAVPGRKDEVRAQLERLRGVEIHVETPEGRFVVTAEDTPDGSAAAAIMRMHQLDGVLSAAMVYQYCDDEKRDDQEETP